MNPRPTSLQRYNRLPISTRTKPRSALPPPPPEGTGHVSSSAHPQPFHHPKTLAGHCIPSLPRATAGRPHRHPAAGGPPSASLLRPGGAHPPRRRSAGGGGKGGLDPVTRACLCPPPSLGRPQGGDQMPLSVGGGAGFGPGRRCWCRFQRAGRIRVAPGAQELRRPRCVMRVRI